MFTLTATTNKAEGIINIPILQTMTNEDMAQAILNGISGSSRLKAIKRINEIKTFVKTLRNEPERIFINPYNDVCEDSFICSFDFVETN